VNVERLEQAAAEAQAAVDAAVDDGEEATLACHAVLGAMTGRLSALHGELYTMRALADMANHIAFGLKGGASCLPTVN
jgi:hypothetical protein